MTANAVWLTFVLSVAISACGASEHAEVLPGASAEAGAASASCEALAACCPSLPSEVASSCKSLSGQASSAECGEELAALASVKRCTTSVDASAGSASPDATISMAVADAAAGSVDAAVGCVLLGPCCASPALPSDETVTCQSIEGAGDEGECAKLLTDLTSAGSCSGVATGSAGPCPELASCCSSQAFPSTFVGDCQETVSQAQASACSSELATFVSAGYCGGVVAGTDGGHPLNTNCQRLSMCCGEITFPAATLSTCENVAAANVSDSCLSAYNAYVVLSYCD